MDDLDRALSDDFEMPESLKAPSENVRAAVEALHRCADDEVYNALTICALTSLNDLTAILDQNREFSAKELLGLSNVADRACCFAKHSTNRDLLAYIFSLKDGFESRIRAMAKEYWRGLLTDGAAQKLVNLGFDIDSGGETCSTIFRLHGEHSGHCLGYAYPKYLCKFSS